MHVVSMTEPALFPNPARLRKDAVADFSERMTNRILDALHRFVPDARRAVLVDLPAYTNVGDTAIWLGERRLLRSLRVTTVAEYSLWRYRPEQVRAHRNLDVIFLQGGGNFGDLWPHHHQLRLRVVRDFPNLPIVQMPQSICFRDQDLFRTTARILRDHPRFYLLVRDEPSLALAEQLLPSDRVALVPDCAFGLGPLTAPIAPSSTGVLLLRTDQERLESAQSALRSWADTRFRGKIPTGDWTRPEGPGPALERLADRVGCILERLPTTLPAVQFHLAAAHLRMQRGLRFLAQGEQVGCDRLHALILALLLGKQVHFADTKQGKVGAYYRTWLQNQLPWIHQVA